MRYFIIFFVFILLNFGCSNQEFMSNSTFNYNSKPTNRDSLFIDYTIRYFMKHGHLISSYRSIYIDNNESEIEKFTISIDRVFYSPDSLKFIGWVIIPDYKNTDGSFFLGKAIVGYRNSTDIYWNIYPYDFLQPGSSAGDLLLRNVFNNYFFNKIKKSEVYGYTDGEQWGSIPLTYSIDQLKFWDGPVFDTSLYHGYYMFQIADFRNPDYLPTAKRELIYEMKIEYPDTLLSIY